MPTQPHPYKSERTDLLVAVEGNQKEEVVPERYPGFLTDNQDVCDPDVEWIEERVVGGDRDPYQHVEGPRSFEGGSWTVVPYDGWPIAWVLGAESVSETADGNNEHVITRKQDGPPPTATVEGDFYGHSGQGDFSRGLLGVAPDSGTIEVNNEEELQVSMSNTALGITQDTRDGSRAPTTGVTLPDRKPWTFRRTTSNLTIFGTEFARVEDFSLEVTNNLSAERYIEAAEAPQGEPYEMLYGNGEYSLDLDITVSDDAIYQELVNPTEGGFDMSIEFTKASGAETLLIEGSGLRMEDAPHSIPDEGKVSVSVSITPRTTQVTVVDTQSSGPYLSAGAAP